MPNELYPIRGQWYAHLKKGQRFFISAIDEDGGTVEIQHFDGDLEEATFEEWRELDIELSVAPENWAGALDVGEWDEWACKRGEEKMPTWLALPTVPANRLAAHGEPGRVHRRGSRFRASQTPN